MKERGLPVGEIFESEIKDIPTKRFSKYFDDESKDGNQQFNEKFQSFTARIFPTGEDKIISDTTSIMPITITPATKPKKLSIVPNLVLDNLPPRRLHYFSEDSKRSGLDVSYELKKKRENVSLVKKYNL